MGNAQSLIGWNKRVYPTQLLAPDETMIQAGFFKHDNPLRWVRGGTSDGGRDVIAIFHGNAETAESALRLLPALDGFTVVAFEYPTRLEQFPTFVRDAAASIIDDPRNRIRAVFGRSLGSAVALQAALMLQPPVVILESAFLTPTRTVVGATTAGIIDSIVDPTEFFNNEKTIEKLLSSKILVIHGTDDVVVPHDHAVELHRRAPLSELVSIPRATHNEGMEGDLEHIEAFLARFGEICK